MNRQGIVDAACRAGIGLKPLARAGLIAVGLFSAATAEGKATCTPAPTTVLSVAPINVPANPQLDQVIGDPDGYIFNIPDGLTCTYDTVFTEYWSFMSMPADMPFTGRWVVHQGIRMPVYLTGVIGVGFAMIAQDRDGGTPQFVSTGVANMRGPMYPGLPSWGVGGRLFFFVTGEIKGGSTVARTVSMLSLNGTPGFHSIVLGATQISPPGKPTCSVSTPSLPLSLGVISSRDFSGVGSVAGAATGTIVLQCAGGSGANLDVLVTLTDQTTPANRTDRLSLTGTSQAGGVALQLLHGATLLRYGPDSATLGNPNQWLAGSTGNGTFQIPLTARYIQTEPKIRPGTANGLATFTLSYR